MVDMSRRDFMLAGSTSLLSLDSSVVQQVDVQQQGQPNEKYEFSGVADLLGPSDARPAAGGEFFENKIAYAYRYQETDTGAEWFITEDDDQWSLISMPLKDYSTPFQALKTASQFTQFAIDPSKGLTRRRYGWYSNNLLFDTTHVTSNDANGTIGVNTGSTANTARIRSALAGQYISQSLAQPGVGLRINDSNLTLDGNDRVSLSHGNIAVGAGWHDGSAGGWGVGGPVQTFLGLRFDSSGAYAELIANGQRVGGSPVPQSEWNLDPMDGTGPSGEVLRPGDGYIYNSPYTWYGYGALYVGIIHPERDEPILMHQFELDQASFDRPNMPTMAIADDGGSAATLDMEIGGMQYALYGAQLSEEAGEERATEAARTGLSVGTASVDSNNAVDPQAEPGVPVIAFQRKSGVRDVTLRTDQLLADTDASIYLFAWDEFEPGTALTGANFRDPHEPVTATETKVQVDTEATDYTPTQALARGVDYVATDKNQSSLQQLATDDRIPIDATRIITAVHDGASATLDPAQLRIVEGY